LCETRSYELVSNSEWLPREIEKDRERELLETLDPFPLNSFCWGWMKSEVYRRKVVTPDELHARI